MSTAKKAPPTPPPPPPPPPPDPEPTPAREEPPRRRTSRRSQSRRREGGPQSRSPMPGSRAEGSEDEVPDSLLRRLSDRSLRNLSDEECAILYGVRKVEDTQRHFKDSTWKLPDDSAASGAEPVDPAIAREDANARSILWIELVTHANPLPSLEEWAFGMNHKSDREGHARQLWEPVRAIHSNKMFCLRQLEEAMLAASGATEPAAAEHALPVRERGGRERRGLVFTEAFPDTRESGGMLALKEAGWSMLKLELGILTHAAWVKHLLTMHDGEVRFVGDPWWVDTRSFPASGGSHSLCLVKFWHSQTMRKEKTRNWAFYNHGAGQRDQRWKEGHLTHRDVQWIMDEEDNETQLMKYCPATGGRPSRWLIRQGNYITLGELFVFGARRCSCWDLYRTYRSLEIFIHRKPHSMSGSEEAIFRQNAKRKRFQDTGRHGLDW